MQRSRGNEKGCKFAEAFNRHPQSPAEPALPRECVGVSGGLFALGHFADVHVAGTGCSLAFQNREKAGQAKEEGSLFEPESAKRRLEAASGDPPYRKLRPGHPETFKSSWLSFYTGVVLTTTLDSRELKFLIRQIDEYIQVTEFMIRKTATLDHGELALARNLRTKLRPGKQTEHRRKNIAKKSG
jgi:hypothetical protein